MQDRERDTDVYNGLLDSEGEGEGGMIWENGDNPERCYGEGGGRGVHVWERM